ncbi:hypothetical protein [Streptomyces resistomycificus]|nr:hypothetical protein [Streptomyces resistomycificus]
MSSPPQLPLPAPLHTGSRQLRPRAEDIAGALSADACAAHRAHTQGDRR